MTTGPEGTLERFERSDLRFLLVCATVLVASIAFGVAFFDRAFPEASIEFRVDQGSSRAIAEKLLDELGYSREGRMHAVRFQHEDDAKIFLERTLGLETASGVMGDDVELWWWGHRWFASLRTDEMRVRVSPRGELVGFERVLEETYAAKGLAILAISMDDEPAKVVPPFVKKHGISYTNLLGTAEVAEAFGGVVGLSTIFLVDRNGTIMGRPAVAATAAPGFCPVFCVAAVLALPPVGAAARSTCGFAATCAVDASCCAVAGWLLLTWVGVADDDVGLVCGVPGRADCVVVGVAVLVWAGSPRYCYPAPWRWPAWLARPTSQGRRLGDWLFAG